MGWSGPVEAVGAGIELGPGEIALRGNFATVGDDGRLIDRAMAALVAYDWPGNVRELQNLVERELILFPEGPLTFEQIQHESAPGWRGGRLRQRPRLF